MQLHSLPNVLLYRATNAVVAIHYAEKANQQQQEKPGQLRCGNTMHHGLGIGRTITGTILGDYDFFILAVAHRGKLQNSKKCK